MTLETWLQAHPYLEPVARVRARIDAAVEKIDAARPQVPDWDDYTSDFAAGVPLIRSADAAIDLEPAGTLILDLIERLASDSLRDRLTEDALVLGAALRNASGAEQLVIDALLGGDPFALPAAGLLRCAGWIGMARYLRPVVNAFDSWRDEDRWLRRYCPTCGTLPAMAQLVGVDPGRLRLLSCGCCGTRWRYARTGCPFCETASHRLASVGIDGEGGLRIDYCESCRGYLKTYNGRGDEGMFLADWTSLHLDLVAHSRGLKRLAPSLYALDPALHS